MSNFWQRTLTGICFVAVLLTCIYFQQDHDTLSILFSLCTVVGLFEFYRMAAKGGEVKSFAFPLVCGVLLYIAFMHYADIACADGFIAYVVALFAMAVAELFMAEEKPMEHLAVSILGNLYVAVPFGLLTMLANEPIYWTFALFILTWVFDTGAYLTGRAFGRHKMFERISPKKTWEGEIGGIVLALAAGWIFSVFFEETELWHWLVFAFAVAVSGTMGDLLESMFKREAGVKDSGKLLPGHGGILDRFDSSLFAIPVAYLLLTLFEL